MTMGVVFGLLIVTLFAWFIGLMVEVGGAFTVWKDQGTTHSKELVEQDLEYIAAAPRSLIIDDTEAFARRIIALLDVPLERFGIREFYEFNRDRNFGQAGSLGASMTGHGPLKGGVRETTHRIGVAAAKWTIIATQVAQDVLLRLSVALFALPAFLLACLVGTVDGLVRRDLRRWRGGRESSFVYHHAKRYTVWALTGGFGIYLSWPVGGFNPAYMVLVFAVLVAATLSTTVASFKKYL